jgi:hypothetical protein
MSFEFSVIEVCSLTEAHLQRICDIASRFGFTGLCHMTTEFDKFQFLDHSDWGVPPVDDEARAFMVNHQRELQRASEYAHSRGLRFYMWRRELRLPVGFVAKYGPEWIDFANPEVWKLVDWNIRQLFKVVPLCDGLVLSCTGEQKPGEWITANGVASNLPLADRFERMFRCVSTACGELGKELVVRNHGAGEPGLTLDGGAYMRAFMEAARRVGPELTVMAKANEHDFQVAYPFNMVLPKMAAQQPTVAEFALAMEYNGVGTFPCPIVEQLEFMMRYMRANPFKGLAVRYDWYPCEHQNVRSYSVFGNMNQVNGYAFGRLLNEPGVRAEVLYRDFCRERFGETAAETALGIYRHLYEAGGKKQCVMGHQTCASPTGRPMDPESLFSMLRMAPRTQWSLLPGDFVSARTALDPDEDFIDRVRDEKDRAEAIYAQALTELRTNRARFSAADAAMLETGLVRALAELAIQRAYYVAVFRLRRYELHAVETCRAEAERLLDECRALVAEYRATYDAHELDPDSGDAWLFGKCTSGAVEKAASRLEEASLWHRKYPGNTNLLQYSNEFQDALELRTRRFVLSFDHCRAWVHRLVRDGQVLAENVPLVQITEGGLAIKPEGLMGHLCRACREDDVFSLQIWCRHGGMRIAVSLDEGTGAVSVQSEGRFAENATVEIWSPELSQTVT